MKKNFIDINIVDRVISLARQEDVFPFVNTLQDNLVNTYYSHLSNPAVEAYYNHRRELSGVDFIIDVDYSGFQEKKVFNISMLSTYENLKVLHEKIQKFDGIVAEFFSGYNFDGYWWLEVSPKDSGKGNALDLVRKHYKPKKIVCFGDNLNDISMFEKADYVVVPDNAVPEAKKLANEVIGHCNDDSVAEYIKNDVAKS